MEHIINISWDDEACVWYAACDSIPLALENDSLDALIERVMIAAPEMLALNGVLTPNDHLCIRAECHRSIA